MKFRQIRHSCRIRRIRQNRRFVGTPILSSIDLSQNFVKIAILAEFAGFVKIAASSVPLFRAQSLFGEISSKSPFSLNSSDLSKSPLCWYPYLELNRSSAKFIKVAILAKFAGFVKIAILAEFAGFVKIAALSVPPSRAQSLFCEIFQNRHSRQICRTRQNCRFVGTPISSSIAL